MRSGKLVGYCPDCNLPIVSYEVKKNVYTCGGCGGKKRVAKLLKERILVPKPIIEDLDIEEDEATIEDTEEHSLNARETSITRDGMNAQDETE